MIKWQLWENRTNQVLVSLKARSQKYSAAVAFSRSLHSFHFVTNMSSWCGHARLKVQTQVFNCRKEKFKVWNRSRRNLEEFPDWFRKTYWLPSSFKKCMCARLPLSCSLSLSSRDLLSLTETVWRAIQLETVLVEFWKRPGSLPPPPWLCSKSPKNFRQTQWIWFYFTF